MDGPGPASITPRDLDGANGTSAAPACYWTGSGSPKVKVREKGWLNIRIAKQARYFEATGVKGDRSRKIMIDALTGQADRR